MQVFSKGNDIETIIEAFSDASLRTVSNLGQYYLELLLYTAKGNRYIYASTYPNSDVTIETVRPGVLRVVLRKELFQNIRDGEVKMEVRLTDIESGLSSITTTTSFILEDSEINRIRL